MARVTIVRYSWCVRNCRMDNWFKKNLYKLHLGKNSAVKGDGGILSLRIWWSSCSLNSGAVGEVHVSWAAPNLSSVLDYSAVLVLNNTCMCKSRIYTLTILFQEFYVPPQQGFIYRISFWCQFLQNFTRLVLTDALFFSHESWPGLCRCLMVRFNLWASCLSGDLTL